MPSTDTKPELTAKSSMAQPVSQPAVYANGLKGYDMREGYFFLSISLSGFIKAVTVFRKPNAIPLC
jgi:hypothetical protein